MIACAQREAEAGATLMAEVVAESKVLRPQGALVRLTAWHRCWVALVGGWRAAGGLGGGVGGFAGILAAGADDSVGSFAGGGGRGSDAMSSLGWAKRVWPTPIRRSFDGQS